MTETLFCFQFIKWQQIPNTDHYVTEWLLVIENIETLEKYTKKRARGLMGTYYKMKKKKFTGHCSTGDELMLETALTCGRGEKSTLTVIDDCVCIADKIVSAYSEMFLIDGVIFITENDCIRPIKNIEKKTFKTENKEVLAWPLKDYTENDISVTKWPGGKHYYAKIRNIEVVDEEGDIKWSSTEEAERQAKIFLKRLING